MAENKKDALSQLVRFEKICRYVQFFNSSNDKLGLGNRPSPAPIVNFWKSILRFYDIFSIFMANKGIAIADTFDKNHTDATLMPEVYEKNGNLPNFFRLFPRRGFIKDLTWFPNDNSLTAILSNTGSFNLIDMNNMAVMMLIKIYFTHILECR